MVVINEAMAKQFWPTATPLGERLVIGRGVMREFADEPERQIIGVVGDTRDGGLNSDPGPTMYIPQAQVPDAANALNVGLGPMAWVVRTAGEPIGDERRHPGSSCARPPACPSPNVRAMAEVVSPVDVARAVQHVADDGLRRWPRCCWPRSASTG